MSPPRPQRSLEQLREAVERQLESSPRIIQGITAWVDSLPAAPTEDE